MKQKATLSVITAGVLWGIISIFIKTLSASGFSSLQITMLRMTFSALIFTIIIAVKNPEKLRIQVKDIWMFIGTGIVSIVLFNTCYFYTMINSQTSVAVVLLYTSPVFVMLMSALIYKEKITVKKLVALVLTVFGCVFVTGVVGGVRIVAPKTLIIGLGAGFFYAMYTIFGRAALKKYDTVTVTVYTFVFATLGSLPLGKVGETFSRFIGTPSLILWCVGIAVVSTVLPYFLYTWGLERMESGKAAILVAVEPVIGAIMGMAVYNEPHNILKIIGILMILSAIIVLGINRGNKSKKLAKRY